MNRLLLLSLGLALTACPTPPEEIPQQAGPNAGGPPQGEGGPNGPPGQGGGPPPGEGGGPPQGEGGQPMEGGPDMAPQGEQPQGEGPGPDAPPQGEGAGPDAPPQGEGPGPDAPPQGEGLGPDGQGEGPGPDAPPQGEGAGPDGPPQGEGPDAPPQDEEGAEEANNTPPPNNVPEDGPPEGGVIENSILIKVDRVPPGANNPQQTQDEIASGQFVTFSGTAACSDCSGQLILRVAKFLGPNEVPTQTDLLTQIILDGPGDFSVKIPTSQTPVGIELLVDEDSSGGPTQGERFAVVELGGTLVPDQERSDLSLDATDREIDNPGFFGQQ